MTHCMYLQTLRRSVRSHGDHHHERYLQWRPLLLWDEYDGNCGIQDTVIPSREHDHQHRT